MKPAYEVADPSGRIVLTADASCRYPRKVDLSILNAGYPIRLGGRKLTKTEARKELQGQ